MNPQTGKVVVEGVVQIAVATLAKNPIAPEDVPNFMKRIGDQLVQCIKDADAALADVRPAASTAMTATAPTAAAVPESRQESTASAAESAQPPITAATAPSAVSEAPATAAEALVSAAKAPATAAEAPAAAAEAPAAAAEGEQGEVTKPKARKAAAPKPPYKFAHISRKPVIPVNESVREDAIVCLIDGAERKMMQRHLRSKYNMSEEEYREHFHLPAEYPMVAPGYSREKSVMAQAQGLGTPRLYENKKATPAKVTKRSRSKQAAPASA